MWKNGKERRALTAALAEVGCGCFVPDLTRFTIPQCAGARRLALYSKAGFVPKETIIFPTTVPVYPK